MQRTRISRYSLPVVVFASFSAASAETVAENNRAGNPPLFTSEDTNCTAEFKLKSAGANDRHGFVVITGPDGRLLELRGGPSQGGSGGSSAPGSSSGSGPQPSGNPFGCETSSRWGVVVPYVGLHGRLGTDDAGLVIYSPDGVAADVNYSVSIGPGTQPNICKMANCMMTIIKALGASCKNYTVGTGALRNSNTLISLALSSCGVSDPLPAGISAPGWGAGWN